MHICRKCTHPSESVHPNGQKCAFVQFVQFCFIFTSRVCGRGNVFVVFVCLSVCLSVRTITFEARLIQKLHFWYAGPYLGQVKVSKPLGQHQGLY